MNHAEAEAVVWRVLNTTQAVERVLQRHHCDVQDTLAIVGIVLNQALLAIPANEREELADSWCNILRNNVRGSVEHQLGTPTRH